METARQMERSWEIQIVNGLQGRNQNSHHLLNSLIQVKKTQLTADLEFDFSHCSNFRSNIVLDETYV